MKKLLSLLLFLSCTVEEVPSQERDYWKDFTPFYPEYDASALPISPIHGQKTAIDTVSIDEISGMISSKRYPGYAWVHNDSGNDPELILIRLSDARIMCKFRDADIQNVDWEDIASYQDKAGKNWIVIGDIGDNLAQRTNATLYYLEEPDYHDSLEGKEMLIEFNERARHFFYPDGARDAEALFVDHDRGDTYIISKRDARSRVYALPFENNSSNWDTAIFCGSFPFNTVTAVDIKFDERILIVRTYLDLYTWHWNYGSDIREVMGQVPQKIYYDQAEPQGEAITWSTADKSYYTLSERRFGVTPVLYRWTYPY